MWSNRQSYSLEMSHGSLHHAEIGQAVPVHVFGGNDARVRRETEVSIEDNIEDDLSLVSESQVQLGRLNTIKLPTSSIIAPEYTVNTTVENVIPPRLKRRPVSEIVVATPKQSANHQHRFSLNISDDLDKLMESANDLKSTEESAIASGDSPASSPNRAVAHSRLNSMLSSDSFQTAGEGISTPSLPFEGKDVTAPLTLPKRPNADNMEKARQASHHYSSRGSIGLQDQTEIQEDTQMKSDGHQTLSDNKSVDLDDQENETDLKNVEVNDINRIATKEEEGVQFSDKKEFLEDIAATESEQMGIGSPVKSKSVKSMKSIKSLAQPSPTGEEFLGGAAGDSHGDSAKSSLHTPIKKETTANALTPRVQNSANDSLSSSNTTDFIELGQPVDLGLIQLQNEIDKNISAPQANTLLSRSEIASGQVRDSVYTKDYNDDDGYYDIEDPVLVSKPSRSKSVKESIQNPKRKASKRKSGRRKLRDASNLQLKPFSYNTLIHLLESMNGTVIGEEFESLNLPIKEKQMIEKIVDSLSRLTLDMVIDENRFEVGMERLEKAHRVLEGFL